MPAGHYQDYFSAGLQDGSVSRLSTIPTHAALMVSESASRRALDRIVDDHTVVDEYSVGKKALSSFDLDIVDDFVSAYSLNHGHRIVEGIAFSAA